MSPTHLKLTNLSYLFFFPIHKSPNKIRYENKVNLIVMFSFDKIKTKQEKGQVL